MKGINSLILEGELTGDPIIYPEDGGVGSFVLEYNGAYGSAIYTILLGDVVLDSRVSPGAAVRVYGHVEQKGLYACIYADGVEYLHDLSEHGTRSI